MVGIPMPACRRTAEKDAETLAPVKFIDDSPRFPAETNLRPDMGNNGYCVMSLHDDSNITIEYIDWMSRMRCQAELIRENESLAIASVKEFPA